MSGQMLTVALGTINIVSQEIVDDYAQYLMSDVDVT
jgi:hypothetical protein